MHIHLRHPRYFLEGYCDTGNFLNANDNIPIIFVNKRIKIGKYKNEIIINSLSTKKKIRIYTVDDFKIRINDRLVSKDVYIAYGNIKYDIMFGLDLLGG